ncbi:hypothetical protein [Candidatus Hodarchaeum mangrovi]
MKHKFKIIGLGGTFDRFHNGHKLMLDVAAYFGKEIHLGLTGNSYLIMRPKHLNKIIQNYQARCDTILDYFKKYKENILKITELSSLGMDQKLASESSLEALIVSQETLKGALLINKNRIANKKSCLKILVIPFVLRENGSNESSTKLRYEDSNK